MNCGGSEISDSSEVFDCRNMGEVLGKECVKEEVSFAHLAEDIEVENADGAACSNPDSESDSDKDLSIDSDEDISWLLSVNAEEIKEVSLKKCKCEGCLKRYETYSSEKKNAKLLLQNWKEFRSYIRNVYINSPLDLAQRNESLPEEDNDRLHEIIQVMKLCDPYQLFQKIEDEVRSMVLDSRGKQLKILKDKSNQALAEEFITGLIEEYVKLLSSALQLSPTIEILLGPQLQRFGLTWEYLNKHLYQSLVYSCFEVQENLPQCISQLRAMLPMKDEIYQELIHQYLAFDDEMTEVGTMWKDIEPLIQEYRNLKSKEDETLNNLQDALKAFFANKIFSSDDEEDESREDNPTHWKNDNSQYCPNCMTRGCPCDECTVTHMMSCEGIDSPFKIHNALRSRSRSPIKSKENKLKSEGELEEQQLCECYACTAPPPDLMDCSVTFNQSTGKTSLLGEGFQLYPHIHGKIDPVKIEPVPDIYTNLQNSNDSFFPQVYKLCNQNSNLSKNQQNLTLDDDVNPFEEIPPDQITTRLLELLATSDVEPKKSNSPPAEKTEPSSKSKPISISIPKSITAKSASSLTPEELAKIKKSLLQNQFKKTGSGSDLDMDNENKRNEVNAKKAKSSDSGKGKSQQNSGKSNGCLKPSVCGKCVKHGNNCTKTPACSKNKDKHLAAIARLGLSSNTSPRGGLRCGGGKDGNHTHKAGKGHSCSKSKSHDIIKKVSSKLLEADGLDGDDSSSQEDSCSERSNSTSTSTQKDSRHCDCCYCEVFGHGVPSVAPVSRNYQEMRERLRLRLNMKKKCKTTQQVPPNQKLPPGATPKPQPNAPQTAANDNNKKSATKEEDLDSLLKFIEGSNRQECTDAKKAAKRIRQKEKKIEQERLEQEAEKKRLAAMKKLKKKQNQASQKAVNQTRSAQSAAQALNLSGLKSLVEKTDPNTGPKMVTIRRVMAPFSSEPTVTITLKGSTPDKDKVLFMLQNGAEALQPEEKENTAKTKKKKRKQLARQLLMEAEPEPEPYYEEEPIVETSKKKKKKNKNKEIIDEPVITKSNRSHHNQTAAQPTTKLTAKENLLANNNNNSSKTNNKNSKTNSVNSKVNQAEVKKPNQKVSVLKSQSNDKNLSVNKDQKPVKNVIAKDQKNNNNNKKDPVKSLNKNENSSTRELLQRLQNNQYINIMPKSDWTEGKGGDALNKKNIKCNNNNNNNHVKNPVGNSGGVSERSVQDDKSDKNKVIINTPSYRLSEVLNRIAPSPPPREEINLENLRLPPGITITKIEGPIPKTIRASEHPGHVSKPVPLAPPIVVSTPHLRPNPPPPSGNVIVVDTGRLKEVINESSQMPASSQSASANSKKKKKKSKTKGGKDTVEIPISQQQSRNSKTPKNGPLLDKPGLTVLTGEEARKMVPNLDSQQATIIKTSDNMVTIRSPALQQAMNFQAYQSSHHSNYKPGCNGYNNVSIFKEDVDRLSNKMGNMKLDSEDRLSSQMRNLNIKDGSRASEIFAQAMAAAARNDADETSNNNKKKKKKKKNKKSDDKEVEPVESVFQPKDIDLENGDIDDDERELEAFKRFCLQSVPPARKDKVKVNLNIKDIVLKKKSSSVGCS